MSVWFRGQAPDFPDSWHMSRCSTKEEEQDMMRKYTDPLFCRRSSCTYEVTDIDPQDNEQIESKECVHMLSDETVQELQYLIRMALLAQKIAKANIDNHADSTCWDAIHRADEAVEKMEALLEKVKASESIP